MELKKLANLELSTVASLEEAARFIFRENLLHLQHNVQLFLAENSGRSLMQVRIATRRIRMAMTTFKPFLNSDEQKKIEREFKHFGRKMGRARDLDVLLYARLTSHCPITERKVEYDQLRLRISKERDQQFAKIRTRLQDKRFQALLSNYEGWLEQPFDNARLNDIPAVREFAGQAISSARGTLLKRGQSLDWKDIKGLHKFRKYVKQYRYNIRFFASLLEPDIVQNAYDVIVPLQDYLGDVNDIHVGSEIIQEFVDDCQVEEDAMGRLLLQQFTEELGQKLALSQKSLPMLAKFKIAPENFL